LLRPIQQSVAAKLDAPGYAIDKTIHSGKSSDVYAGVRQADGLRVVLKRYTRAGLIDGAPTDEWEALTKVAGVGIPRPIELIDDSPPVLVLEHVPGVPLGSWLEATGEIDVAALLDIAICLAEVLGRVHAARLLHRDLHPHNILVHPETRSVHLIDLGRCRPMGARASCMASSNPIGGSLHFIAPEQTGRMNRGCDPRSDLYSLGAILYFALTGQPPLDGRDKLEIIHAHIARRPRDPRELRADIPEPLAVVVLRLLAKEPEERYPSAEALVRDLRTLGDELSGGGALEDSSLLRGPDPRVGIRISPSSFGRAEEVQAVLAAYEAARAGTTQVVLVDGELGTGKSSLARALRVRVAETRGYLAAATFDSGRERPYSGWAQLLQSLADQVLLESDERLCEWRRRFVDGVGSIASVLVELASDLRFVLGDVQKAPILGPLETRARLSLAIRRMVEVFARNEHPLVLFLDDLHWSDSGTRHVLSELVPREVPGRALLIVATLESSARDSDVARELTLVTQRGLAPLRRLTLGPLSRADVERMLAEALECDGAQIGELAGWIERKTSNNPLLIQGFLDHLYERGLVAFSRSRGWHWDIAEIAALSASDDAAMLLAEKLQGLAPDARQIA